MRPKNARCSVAQLARLALFSAALVVAASLPAQTFPTRPVRILVPLTTGGGMDSITRGLAQKLSETFGQSVIVDNRPGAGSQVALDILSSAAPDGHTLAMVSLTPIIHPMLYKSRFDLLRDFAPVSQVSAQGYILVVHPSVPGKSMSEFVDYLRANSGKLNFSSTGIGSPIHMAGELFQIATGTRWIHVPYKGVAYNDLIGGRIHVTFATPISSAPHLQSGRLRGLAVTTPKRIGSLPEYPTMAEAGVKDMVVVNWYGLIAPARTPQAVIARISKETHDAMHAPEMAKRLASEGTEPVGSAPSEFVAHIRGEHALWSRVITQAGIRAER